MPRKHGEVHSYGELERIESDPKAAALMSYALTRGAEYQDIVELIGLHTSFAPPTAQQLRDRSRYRKFKGVGYWQHLRVRATPEDLRWAESVARPFLITRRASRFWMHDPEAAAVALIFMSKDVNLSQRDFGRAMAHYLQSQIPEKLPAGLAESIRKVLERALDAGDVVGWLTTQQAGTQEIDALVASKRALDALKELRA